MARISKEESFLRVAKSAAERSTCLRRKVGSVIVDMYNCVVSTGYNNPPKGRPHCDEIGYCYREKMNIPSGEHFEKCNSMHSELNALIQAGKESREATMFLCTLDKHGDIVENYPCLFCSKAIINADIFDLVIAINNDFEYIRMSADEMFEYVNERMGMYY